MNAYKLLTSANDILIAVGFLNGLSVDDLKSEKWDLKKNSKDGKVSFPNSTKRSISRALCGLSFHQLYDVQKKPGLWRNILKSMSILKFINQVSEKARNKQEKQHIHVRNKCSKLYVVLAGLRKDKYPATAEEYEKQRWKDKMAEPLNELCSDSSKYEFSNKKWLSKMFESELANLKFHLPVRLSVESQLSLHGNCCSTWTTLIDRGHVSGNQLLQNMRSLVLLNFPVPIIEQQLMKSITNKNVSLMQLMKIDTLFTSGILSESGRKELLLKLEVASQQPPIKKKKSKHAWCERPRGCERHFFSIS